LTRRREGRRPGDHALSCTIAYAYDNLDNRTNMLIAPASVNGAAIHCFVHHCFVHLTIRRPSATLFAQRLMTP